MEACVQRLKMSKSSMSHRPSYELKAYHLKALINYTEQGYALSTYDDVSPEVRDSLYAVNQ